MSSAGAEPAFAGTFWDPPFTGKGSVPGAGPDFYPLASGNRWHYDGRFAVRIVAPDGETIEDDELLYEVDQHQTCVVTIGDRDYLTEEIVRRGGGTFVMWVRYRQDVRGLYEADVTGLEPSCQLRVDAPGAAVAEAGASWAEAWQRAIAGVTDPGRRAAFERAWQEVRARIDVVRGETIAPDAQLRPSFGVGGPLAGELLRLSYPLAPGRRWIIRESPRFTAIVEAPDVLELAPGLLSGWRIRYDNEFLGRNDRVHVWYGPQGLLQLTSHIETDAVDEGGSVIGRLITEDVQVLDELDLVTPVAGVVSGTR
jgi:hypothetical protein